jgi:gas vesicle protein
MDKEQSEAPAPAASRSARAGFGVGLFVGALLGAAVALLFAPAPGQDTRRRLRRTMGDVRDRLGEEVSDLDHRLREKLRRRLR